MPGKLKLWDQIYQDLLNKILTKQLNDGDLLPSEKSLQEKYDVSRVTVRTALSHLEESGRILVMPGKGRVVGKKVRNESSGVNVENKEVFFLSRPSPDSFLIYKGIKEELFRLGVGSNMMMSEYKNSFTHLKEIMDESKKADGIIVFLNTRLNNDVLSFIKKSKTPVIVIGSPDHTICDTLAHNYQNALFDLFDQARAKGFSKAIYCYNSMIDKTNPVFYKRRDNFCELGSGINEMEVELYPWNSGLPPEEEMNALVKKLEANTEKTLILMESVKTVEQSLDYLNVFHPDRLEHLTFAAYGFPGQIEMHGDYQLLRQKLQYHLVEDWESMGLISAQKMYFRLFGSEVRPTTSRLPCYLSETAFF